MEFMYNTLLPITTEPSKAPVPTNAQPNVPESTQTEPNEDLTEPSGDTVSNKYLRVPYSLVGTDL